MIKIYGSGLVASWRPHEEGGSSGAHMRASEKHCDHILVYGDIVIMQYHDGFWETGSLTTSAIIWTDKPEVYIVDTATGRETRVEVKGNTDTIADNLKIVLRKPTRGYVPMTNTDEDMEGAYFQPKTAKEPELEESDLGSESVL